MIGALMSTPSRWPAAFAPDVVPAWLDATRPTPPGRREQLAPGVYVLHAATWQPVSVLDVGELVPPVTDTQDIRPVPVRIEFPDWHAQALCNGLDGADVYFFGADDVKRPTLPPTAVRRARSYCDACPAARDCLTAALTNGEEFGIWGGTTGRQRRALRARLALGESVGSVVDSCLGQATAQAA